MMAQPFASGCAMCFGACKTHVSCHTSHSMTRSMVSHIQLLQSGQPRRVPSAVHHIGNCGPAYCRG